MGMAAPAVAWALGGIIVGIVIRRHVDRRAIGHIAVVFLLECLVVIFKVVKDIQRAVVWVFDQAGAGIGAAQKGAQTCGVDLVFTAGIELCALPRSIAVEV